MATAGSVDDGKSTLIGRLLHDTKSILADELETVERDSLRRGHEEVNLALLTDGLRAEREQGITIDAAYRYFATPRRSFVLIDTPGHVQYTRNMVSGTSTADLALVLVDARHGVVEQTRRHASIAALLRVPHVVLAVNKMDLVGWDESVFDAIAADFAELAARLGLADVRVIPLGALGGENVAFGSESLAWYSGPTLLEYLETVEVASSHDFACSRFPVQYVVLSANGGFHDERRYAGQVAGGVLRPGDAVTVLPGGQRSTITGIDSMGEPLDMAFPPQSVSVLLADDIDVARGDMIVVTEANGASVAHTTGPMPTVTSELTADLCWMSEAALTVGARFAIKHTTRSARAVVSAIEHRIDITSGQHHDTDQLDLNDIGRVRLRTTVPLVVDAYAANRVTGRFVLIEEATNATVAAGMVLAAEPATSLPL